MKKPLLIFLLAVLFVSLAVYLLVVYKDHSVKLQEEKEINVIKQQQAKEEAILELEAEQKQKKETEVALQKKFCASEAEKQAVELLKNLCAESNLGATICGEGRYLIANYDNAYSRCLQSKGL